ncbi:dolichyl-P-Man:Man(7)GlcNAc(2)-PP-dolichol alpha-1,6-mannosyltransferase [Ptychographa xylographoides]|nr:dolichyl-P-Man:Man(7)GlcNAc(2)-PP-dolichol alpha-1,6-mannosyltransferase [Ptychographa xylographoides]
MGASWIWTRRNKSMAYRVLALGLVASTLGSFAASFGMLAVSSFNYPGAEALNYLHAYADGSQNVINVHMDTLSCMTGITRFLQISTSNTSSLSGANTLWLYDKSEDDAKLLHPAFWEQFDYVLAERPEKLIGSWEIIYIVEGFKGVELVRPEETLRDSSTPLLVLPSASHISTLGRSFKAVAGWMRIRVTRGWWLQARMEPSVRVLKHIRSSD